MQNDVKTFEYNSIIMYNDCGGGNMKKYNTLFLVAITVLVFILLTWIFPVTYLNGELISAERAQAGIMNLFSYPIFTFYNFIYVFVYLLGIGGIYGLLNKTGAYRIILERVANHVKNREILVLVLTVLLMSIIISFTGFTFEALLILPFIAGVILILGYDKITAMMITVGSISVGIMGTTFSKLVSGTFNEILGTTYTDLIWVKVCLLVILSGVLILNVILHAKKVEKVKDVEESFLVPSKAGIGQVKVWPLATILILFVLTIIVSTVDWSGAFGITFFSDLLENIFKGRVLSKYVVLTVSLLVVLYNIIRSIYLKKKNNKQAKKTDSLMTKKRLIVTIIFGVFALLALLKIMFEDVFKVTDILSKGLELIKVNGLIDAFTWDKLLGSVQAFGNWTYNDYLALMLILMVIIKFTYHISFEDVISNIGNGFKNVLYGAIVVILSYTVLIIISSHPVVLTVLKPLLNLTDGLSILWYPICTFVSALCNSDFTYYKYGALSLTYATTFFTSNNIYPLCGLITQSMYGLALMVAPTSSVLLFSLSILDIKYTTWLKKMWKLLLEFVLVIFISYIIVLQFLV